MTLVWFACGQRAMNDHLADPDQRFDCSKPGCPVARVTDRCGKQSTRLSDRAVATALTGLLAPTRNRPVKAGFATACAIALAAYSTETSNAEATVASPRSSVVGRRRPRPRDRGEWALRAYRARRYGERPVAPVALGAAPGQRHRQAVSCTGPEENPVDVHRASPIGHSTAARSCRHSR